MSDPFFNDPMFEQLSPLKKTVLMDLIEKAGNASLDTAFPLLLKANATLKKNGENLTVFHFDLYRLKSPEEIYELGMEEALCEGVSLIEWPQKAEKLLPKERLEIHLEAGNTPEQRTVKIIPKGKRYETENLDL